MSFDIRSVVRSIGKETGTAGLDDYVYNLNWQSADDLNLTEGDGDYEADTLVTFQGTLSSGGSVNYDMLALSRPSGGSPTPTVALQYIKLILIKVDADSAGNLLIGAAASLPWQPFLSSDTAYKTMYPGAMWAEHAPKTGFAATVTARNLKLAALAGSVTYQLAFAGIRNPSSSSSSV